MATAFIGFGSNLGNRIDFCDRAVTLLGLLPHSRLEAVSSLYETEPLEDGAAPGPSWFLNGVVQINILQKAVLGMCRAGVTSPVRVGEKLRIHPDLAELIMKELLQRALIKPDGLPTAAGNEVFEDEALDMRPPVTGHVFQDPWSGELWPRFVQRLDYVELDRRDNGFPDLILGTKGKPRRERAFMCRPVENAVPPCPDVRQILRATHRHKSALRNSESFEVPEDDEQMSLDVGTALQRISLVDDAPTPVFLTTFIYLALKPPGQ